MSKNLRSHVLVGRNYAINMVCYAIAFQAVIILKANCMYNFFNDNFYLYTIHPVT